MLGLKIHVWKRYTSESVQIWYTLKTTIININVFFFSLILWEESWAPEDWQPSSWSRRLGARWWWEARAPWGTKRRSVRTCNVVARIDMLYVWGEVWGRTGKQLEQETGCKIILGGRESQPPDSLVMRLRSDNLPCSTRKITSLASPTLGVGTSEIESG